MLTGAKMDVLDVEVEHGEENSNSLLLKPEEWKVVNNKGEVGVITEKWE